MTKGESPQPKSQTAEGSMRTPQRVYDALKQMILDNELAPGAYVLHEELAQLLGVSRTPVREALIRLEQDGLVEIKPRHGMRVVPISIDAMREIYQILTALEALAAQLAARRGLSDAELTSLEVAVDEMDAALSRNDLEAWAEADSLFHRLLVGFSGNGRLQAIVGTVVDQSHRVRRLTLNLRPKPIRSNSDHRAVVEAVRRRDPDTAYNVHHHHRQTSGEMLIAILQRLNLKVV